jgi:hypothetical protein
MPSLDRFLRHGPVRVSAERTHLTHADGTPFFFLADTAWNGALLSTDRDWETYLDDRAAKGFTAIQFITHAPWTAALTNLEGLTAFTDQSPRSINPAFFDRIERRIEMINARGLLAVPGLAWAANFGASARLNIGHTASAKELIPIIQYQVDRFARHHLIWALAGDGVYNFFRARKWKRIGRVVFGDRADRAPVMLHPAGRTWPYRAFAAERWLDIYGYQSSHSEHAKSLRWLQTGPPSQFWKVHPRPTINLEPVYEDIAPSAMHPPFDRRAIRRAVCWSLLNAPTAGVAYGAHGLWGWHDKPMQALNHIGLGIGQPWRTAMQFPGSADVGRIGELFTSIKWWTLRPDPDLITSQRFSDDPTDHIAASRSSAGDLAVIYLPARAEIALRLDRVNAAPSRSWFDPATGEQFDAATTSGKFSPPGDGDWLLVFQP